MKKIFYLIIVLTLSVLFVQANTQSVLWSENFEGDWTANWHTDAGTWEVGTPTSNCITNPIVVILDFDMCLWMQIKERI